MGSSFGECSLTSLTPFMTKLSAVSADSHSTCSVLFLLFTCLSAWVRRLSLFVCLSVCLFVCLQHGVKLSKVKG